MAGTASLTVPLWWFFSRRLDALTALTVAGGFAALLLFMGVVLAAYFAFLRTAG